MWQKHRTTPRKIKTLRYPASPAVNPRRAPPKLSSLLSPHTLMRHTCPHHNYLALHLLQIHLFSPKACLLSLHAQTLFQSAIPSHHPKTFASLGLRGEKSRSAPPLAYLGGLQRFPLFSALLQKPNLASFRKTEESVQVIAGLRRHGFRRASRSGDVGVPGEDDTPRKPRRRGKPKGVPPEGWVGSAPSALLPSLDVSSSRTRSRLDASHPRHFRPIAELL